MNASVLIGNLGRDPELKFIQGSGKAVCNFSIGVKRPYSQETDWFDITVWGKTAENCAEYLTKGSKVCVQGYFYNDQWEKDGQKRIKTRFNASTVEFLSKKSETTQSNDGFSQAIEDQDLDLPF